MGIHNLIKYIKTNKRVALLQCESGNNIYISNIVYFDTTYKLIEIYNKFMSLNINSNVNYEEKAQELLKFVENELSSMFSRLSSFNRLIYAFVDYKFMNNLNERTVLFKDFLNLRIESNEKINSIPMIKRKYLKLLDNLKNDDSDDEVVMYLFKKVRCMFELKSIYAVSNKLDVEKYISIPYLIKKERENLNEMEKMEVETNEKINDESLNSSNDESVENLNEIENSNDVENMSESDKICARLRVLALLLNEGRFRYLILRGAKYFVKKHRGSGMYSFFNKEELKPMYRDNKGKFNADKLILNLAKRGDDEKINEYVNYIPFTLIIYLFPLIIKNMNLSNVKFLGCEIESDFAISKHVHTYSKYAFPTIYSSDTDMLVNMCDVDCVVKLTIKSNNVLRNEGKIKSSTYFINPVIFWNEIFGCELKPKIIKTLCVLMGTDYNPYHPDSPIHIKSFDEVLNWLEIKEFSEIDEDLLFAKIFVVMKSNNDNFYCKQTAIALNIYLNDLETEIHYITEGDDKNKLNMERFLKYSKRSVF